MTVYAITDTKKGRTGIAPTYLQTTQSPCLHSYSLTFVAVFIFLSFQILASTTAFYLAKTCIIKHLPVCKLSGCRLVLGLLRLRRHGQSSWKTDRISTSCGKAQLAAAETRCVSCRPQRWAAINILIYSVLQVPTRINHRRDEMGCDINYCVHKLC